MVTRLEKYKSNNMPSKIIFWTRKICCSNTCKWDVEKVVPNSGIFVGGLLLLRTRKKFSKKNDCSINSIRRLRSYNNMLLVLFFLTRIIIFFKAYVNNYFKKLFKFDRSFQKLYTQLSLMWASRKLITGKCKKIFIGLR